MTDPFDDIENLAVQLRFILQEAPKRLEASAQELSSCDRELSDLLHVVEFSTFNASEGYKYASQIKCARERRRFLKNELELLEPLMQIIGNVKVDKERLNHAIGEIRKLKKNQETRGYRMRIRSDLQPVIDRQKLKVVGK